MKIYPPNFLDVEPNSPEWLKARIGNATASRIAEIMPKPKGGYYETRAKYMKELLAEILKGKASEHYVTAEMQWGIENEPLARDAYEHETGYEVDRVGFVLHPTIPRCGASPDGLVGEDGGVEIKCPKTETHIDWKLADVVPEKHKPQMYLQMACTGRQWWDFYSYDPRLKDELASFRVRLHRDEKIISEMEAEIEKFLEELADMAMRLCKENSLEKQLERSLEASKAFRKVHDAELMEQLRDEGISVP